MNNEKELLKTIEALREKIMDLERQNAELRSELIVEQHKNLI